MSFLTKLCTILVFRQYADSLHHSVVISGPLKIVANVVIKELLDNPVTVLQLHENLRIVCKGRPAPPLPSLMTHKTKTHL